jgi:hypothetical protein
LNAGLPEIEQRIVKVSSDKINFFSDSQTLIKESSLAVKTSKEKESKFFVSLFPNKVFTTFEFND